MATLYKLTGANDCTMNATQWGEGIEHTDSGKCELCSSGFIHAYEHPLVAVFMNPIHGVFDSPHLWLAEGDIAKRDGQLKCGCTRLRTIKRIKLPDITTKQRVETAILCAKLVCDEQGWNTWSDKWLSGKDRTESTASLAAPVAMAVSSVAGRAAWSAVWAAASPQKAEVADIVKESVLKVGWSAASAARNAAASSAGELDLITILEEVCGG